MERKQRQAGLDIFRAFASLCGIKRKKDTKLISLGIMPVRFGYRGDHGRVRAMIREYRTNIMYREIPINISLGDKHFPRIDEWMEGKKNQLLRIVWFPDERLPRSIADANERLNKEGFQLAGMPHLCALTKIDRSLTAMHNVGYFHPEREGPGIILATDPASFWQGTKGRLYAPGLNVMEDGERGEIDAYLCDEWPLYFGGTGVLVVGRRVAPRS